MVKLLPCDGGKEFDLVEIHMKEMGVELKRTTPYTPQPCRTETRGSDGIGT